MSDDLDRMLSGSAKGFKFENPGDSVTGIIDHIVVRQSTEYGTGTPQTFQDGTPREQIVVTIRADIPRQDDDDDGFRAVYIKGWGAQRRAFIEAVRQARKPEPGDRFTATFVRSEPSKTGGFPGKVFEYRIQAMQATADEAWATAPVNAGVDLEKVTRLRGMGMKDEQIAAALQVSLEAVQDATPF